MTAQSRLRLELAAAVGRGLDPLAAADRLCQACVDLLDIDGAAVSLVHQGASQGTFGSSSALARRIDELQFTLGEGPCLDAASSGQPVAAPDLDAPSERRWPAFSGEALRSGVSAVFAMPVRVQDLSIGALDLYRTRPGSLDDHEVWGGSVAAELAALPLLDLMSSDRDWAGAAEGEQDGWEQLASLERVEVYQATGMVMDATGLDPAEATARIRARAFAVGLTASELATRIVERRIPADADAWAHDPGGREGRS